MSNENRRIRQQSASKPSFKNEIPSDDSGQNGDVVYVRTNNGVENYIKDEGRWVSLNSTRPANEKPYISQVSKNKVITSSSSSGTSTPNTFVSSLSNSSDETNMVGLVEDSTGTIYSLKGGDNIAINVEGTDSSDYVEIDCSISTTNFLANSVNRLEGIRKHSTDAFDFTQSAGSGKYLVIDDDNSNVSVTESTVTIANGTSYNAIRLNAPSVNNTNTTYSIGIPSSTTKLRLTAGGSGSGADDIEFVGGGATTVTRTNDSKFTISSTDTNTDTNNYITGASISSSGVLTLTGSGSAGANVDLSEQFTLTGAGILTATSTATLTNKSGSNNQWTNDAGYVTASSSANFTNKTGSNNQWTNDRNYLTANQTITLSGDITTVSGTTAMTITVTDDSHNHVISNVDNLQTSLDAKAALSGATFTGGVACNGNTNNYPHLVVGGTGNIVNSAAVLQCKGFIRVAQYVLIHETNSSSNSVGLSYANNNLSVYASSGTTAEGSGQANFHVPGDVIAYYSSDPRLKTNKKQLESSLHKLSNINGYTFDWLPEAKKYNSYNKGSDIGVMADEIEAMYPELVETRDNGYKAVKYEKLTAILISAMNELTNKLIEKGVLDEEL